jgi:hypothetical protein
MAARKSYRQVAQPKKIPALREQPGSGYQPQGGQYHAQYIIPNGPYKRNQFQEARAIRPDHLPCVPGDIDATCSALVQQVDSPGDGRLSRRRDNSLLTTKERNLS